jgi:hypothetical protein
VPKVLDHKEVVEEVQKVVDDIVDNVVKNTDDVNNVLKNEYNNLETHLKYDKFFIYLTCLTLIILFGISGDYNSYIYHTS